MGVTNIENQDNSLKEKIKSFFIRSQAFRKRNDDMCPTRDILATVLDKWSLFVIYNLGYYDLLRFNELKNHIPGISSRMLSVTLKRLEENKVISRKVYAEVPPRVEYRLTAFGKQVAEKVMELSDFVVDHYE